MPGFLLKVALDHTAVLKDVFTQTSDSIKTFCLLVASEVNQTDTA